MITNEAELEQARRNLANVDAAIDSLRQELLPNNERNFNLYARPWLDFKEQFEADIEAYLRDRTGPRPDPADRSIPTDTPAADRV